MAIFAAELPPIPSIGEVLTDPGASEWLKDALKSALSRDVVDAANDAELLARLLDREARAMPRVHGAYRV